MPVIITTRELDRISGVARGEPINTAVEIRMQYTVACPSLFCNWRSGFANVNVGQVIHCERCGRQGQVVVEQGGEIGMIYVAWTAQEEPHRCKRCGEVKAPRGDSMCYECGRKEVEYGGRG